MTSDAPESLLACGFIADQPSEGTLFPSAGGNSADPRIQAIYWRCLTMLFATARLTNPSLQLVLFCNVVPPVVDGIDIAAVLDRYDVEVRLVPLTVRLQQNRIKSWGNVLYFFDMMDALADASPDLRIAIVDCDVLACHDLGPLFSLLDSSDFAGYVVNETDPDEDVNGLTRRDLDRIATEMWGPLRESGGIPIEHYGGELFMTTPKAWSRFGALFREVLDKAMATGNAGTCITTEEHVFSLVFNRREIAVTQANGLIKRLWTSPRFNTVKPGDQNNLLWHLPAEKRYGFHDLFHDFARARFPTHLDPDRLREMARRRAGVPGKTSTKVIHDGIRQVAAKLGLRR